MADFDRLPDAFEFMRGGPLHEIERYVAEWSPELQDYRWSVDHKDGCMGCELDPDWWERETAKFRQEHEG